jgi:hypothetical protein
MLLLHPSLKDGVKSPAHDDQDAQITDLPISAIRTISSGEALSGPFLKSPVIWVSTKLA